MQVPGALPVTNPDLQSQIAATQVALSQLVGVVSHLMAGLTTAHGLEWVKQTPLGAKIWAICGPRAKAIVGAVCALVASLGITVAMTHSDPTAGTYTFVVGGLTGASIWTHLGSFIQSWVSQQAAYQGIIKPRTVKPTA